MKDTRFNINLYLIIPVIFGGLTALSVLLTYRVMQLYLGRGLAPEWPLAFWATLLVIFTCACGLLTVKYLIDPVKKFVVRTQTMGVLRDLRPAAASETVSQEIHQFTRVFDQVSEILGKVEARELFPEIVGHSKPMRGILNQILKVAPTDSTVLIIGETGTGKELVAHSIHRHSHRQGKAFMALNCAAIPDGLLESELFGHEKGAFTGASRRKPGKFEIAHEGTLFLDEIGDMPLETQAKVLRALEEGKIQRVGGFHPVGIDVRFISATNKSLPDAVAKGAFRQDLYYRLNVFTVHLPALRERREDIPILAEHFLKGLDDKKQLSSKSLQTLMTYDWPGNVRELKNALKSAALMANSVIEPSHLPSSITTDPRPLTDPSTLEGSRLGQGLTIDERLQKLEKLLIIQSLEQSKGIQKQAARLLGIKERSLWHRLKKYQIDAAEYKNR